MWPKYVYKMTKKEMFSATGIAAYPHFKNAFDSSSIHHHLWTKTHFTNTPSPPHLIGSILWEWLMNLNRITFIVWKCHWQIFKSCYGVMILHLRVFAWYEFPAHPTPPHKIPENVFVNCHKFIHVYSLCSSLPNIPTTSIVNIAHKHKHKHTHTHIQLSELIEKGKLINSKCSSSSSSQ